MRPRNWRSAKVSRPASPASGDGKPVWAGLNAGNLEKLWLPDTVRKVCIYADNDADGDFAGQAFAFALARR
jgi:putative DNA primase/helicase